MYPIIYQYNNLTISSYGLMLMLAFLSCNYLMKNYFISIKKDTQIADDIIFYAAIGGIVGSKIYYIAEFWNTGEGYNNILGFHHSFVSPPHWSAIADAIPINVLLLSVEFLGVLYQPLVYL